MTSLAHQIAPLIRAAATHIQVVDPQTYHHSGRSFYPERLALNERAAIEISIEAVAKSRPRPIFNPKLQVFTHKPRNLNYKHKAPPPAFSVVHILASRLLWDVYDAATGYRMFQVRGTYEHARGQAQRYLQLYGPGELNVKEHQS